MGFGFPLDAILRRRRRSQLRMRQEKKKHHRRRRIVKAPVAVHLDGMLYYNKDVAAKAGSIRPHGVDGRRLADFRQDQGRRFIPIAIAARSAEGYLFTR